MKLTFHSDPGHGWLFADTAQLTALGLDRTSLSTYSYCDGSGVYAEEDCDAGVITNAAKDRGVELEFSEQHTDADHWIRRLTKCG